MRLPLLISGWRLEGFFSEIVSSYFNFFFAAPMESSKKYIKFHNHYWVQKINHQKKQYKNILSVYKPKIIGL